MLSEAAASIPPASTPIGTLADYVSLKHRSAHWYLNRPSSAHGTRISTSDLRLPFGQTASVISASSVCFADTMATASVLACFASCLPLCALPVNSALHEVQRRGECCATVASTTLPCYSLHVLSAVLICTRRTMRCMLRVASCMHERQGLFAR